MKEKLRQILTEGISKVRIEDAQEVLKRKEELEQKVSQEPLKEYIEKVKVLYSLLKDYVEGGYKETPWRVIAAIVVVLLYILNPFDLVPDVIPFLGQVDDAMILAICLKMIDKELEKYENWKKMQTCV